MSSPAKSDANNNKNNNEPSTERPFCVDLKNFHFARTMRQVQTYISFASNQFPRWNLLLKEQYFAFLSIYLAHRERDSFLVWGWIIYLYSFHFVKKLFPFWRLSNVSKINWKLSYSQFPYMEFKFNKEYALLTFFDKTLLINNTNYRFM